MLADMAYVRVADELDALSIGAVCASAEGQAVFANARIEAMVGPVLPGLPSAAWPSAFGLAHADGRSYRNVGEIPLLRALDTDEVRTTMSSRDRSGTVILDCVTAPVLDRRGKLLGSVGVFRPHGPATTRASRPRSPNRPVDRVDKPYTRFREWDPHHLVLLGAALGLAESTAFTAHDEITKQLIDLIKHRYAENWTLTTLAEAMYVHPRYLTSAVSARTGVGAMQLLAQVRISKAKTLLKDADLSIHAVGAAVGLPDVNRFSRTFRRLTTVSPTDYRRRTMQRQEVGTISAV